MSENPATPNRNVGLPDNWRTHDKDAVDDQDGVVYEAAPGHPPYSVGDVVRLLSGGPAMVVESMAHIVEVESAESAEPVSTGWQITCRWFSGRQDNQRDTFDAETLRQAESDPDTIFGYDADLEF